jgi:hypothetical protein
MICPRCGADNESQADHCQKCGFSLQSASIYIEKRETLGSPQGPSLTWEGWPWAWLRAETWSREQLRLRFVSLAVLSIAATVFLLALTVGQGNIAPLALWFLSLAIIWAMFYAKYEAGSRKSKN